MGIKDYKTVANYAKDNGVTVGYIYHLIKDGRLKAEIIDGIKFIDVSKAKVKFKKQEEKKARKKPDDLEWDVYE
jgi:hypothetical protein